MMSLLNGVGTVEGAAGIMATKGSKRTTRVAAAEGTRYDELKAMLEERRRELTSEVQGRIRGVRADGAEKPHEVMDQGETSEVDIQEDIELALIQMKAETLNKINEALARLEDGRYGMCFECGDEIAEARLRALPFAVRCKDCEEAREIAAQRERTLAQRRGSSSLFYDMQG
jgi:RNA polymerase-binding transcription factor